METTKTWANKIHHQLARLRRGVFNRPAKRHLQAQLRQLFAIYRCDNLQGIDRDDFRRQLTSRIGILDAQAEGYSAGELDRQRDFSVKFHWGHNHNFGEFQLEGCMADRHIDLVANFVDFFPVGLKDFKGKAVLDVGCWTGGTSLLLAALGSKVVAIEEVKKYAEMAAFLVRSFGLQERVAVEAKSLYDCNAEAYHDRFDIVFIPGVIYHLSDPVLGLRILFNALKVGGFMLVESAGIHRRGPYCRFDGSRQYLSGDKEQLNRVGWNWFMPTPSALARMIREAGFVEVKTRWSYETRRIYAFGKKRSQVGICKAGLSVPGIR
jgi:2-polyprenyl-3-methyl-5-hydroxy-6-metoxy-1,4-benzoquinol methylase